MPEKIIKRDSIYTTYSQSQNQYIGFNSPEAINRIATIENAYYNLFEDSISPYYGTMWATDSNYFKEMEGAGLTTDSMHCTIYAMEALKAGMGDEFQDLDNFHKAVWNDREYAGWSISYLLTKHYNWKAYLILDSTSIEFERCTNSYNEQKDYNVWKQPDIPLENMFIIGRDDSLIVRLLNENEFGWGFSYQGYHTWITRFSDLKECMWDGAPGEKYYAYGSKSLFKATNFIEYFDYPSHVITFPPKILD